VELSKLANGVLGARSADFIEYVFGGSLKRLPDVPFLPSLFLSEHDAQVVDAAYVVGFRLDDELGENVVAASEYSPHRGIAFLAFDLKDCPDCERPTKTFLNDFIQQVNRKFETMPVMVLLRYAKRNMIALGSCQRDRFKRSHYEGEKAGAVSCLLDVDLRGPRQGHLMALKNLYVGNQNLHEIKSFTGLYTHWLDVIDSAAANERIEPAKNRAETTDRSSLTLFMREIGHIRVLRPDEEISLAAAIAQGSKEAHDQMIWHNLRLVVKIAHDFRNRGLPLEDLIQEGNLILGKAARKFNPQKGAKFSSYAAWWIKQAMHRAISNQALTVRVPVQSASKATKVEKAFKLLSHDLNRLPTDAEISNETGLTERTVQNVRMARIHIIPFEELLNSGREHEIYEFTDSPLVPSQVDVLCWQDLFDKLPALLEQLEERERRILVMRFGLENDVSFTLEEISVRIGRTRERVRQIQKEAVQKLKKMLEDHVDEKTIMSERHASPRVAYYHYRQLTRAFAKRYTEVDYKPKLDPYIHATIESYQDLPLDLLGYRNGHEESDLFLWLIKENIIRNRVEDFLNLDFKRVPTNGPFYGEKFKKLWRKIKRDIPSQAKDAFEWFQLDQKLKPEWDNIAFKHSIFEPSKFQELMNFLTKHGLLSRQPCVGELRKLPLAKFLAMRSIHKSRMMQLANLKKEIVQYLTKDNR
jgi:RNA polymerase primary sigma factor